MQIDIFQVSKFYRNKEKKSINILNDITLTLENNELFSLLGNNGSGKTTLINLISSILHPDKGYIKYIINKDIFFTSKNEKEIKNHIIYCFQDPKFDHRLTVLQNLKFYTKMFGYPREKALKSIKYYLDLFNLSSKKNQRIRSLSGGMAKQLENIKGFISSSLSDPREKLFIIDEPTAYCDNFARSLIWNELFDYYEQGGTLLYSSNDLSEVDMATKKINGRIGFIKDGSILYEGTFQKINQFISPTLGIIVQFIPNQNFDSISLLPDFNNYLKGNQIPGYQSLSCTLNNSELIIENISSEKISQIIFNATMEFIKGKNLPVDSIERKKGKLDQLFVREKNNL